MAAAVKKMSSSSEIEFFTAFRGLVEKHDTAKLTVFIQEHSTSFALYFSSGTSNIFQEITWEILSSSDLPDKNTRLLPLLNATDSNSCTPPMLRIAVVVEAIRLDKLEEVSQHFERIVAHWYLGSVEEIEPEKVGKTTAIAQESGILWSMVETVAHYIWPSAEKSKKLQGYGYIAEKMEKVAVLHKGIEASFIDTINTLRERVIEALKISR